MTVGDGDIGFIVKTFDATGIVIPLEFRKKTYLDLVRKHRPAFPKLKHVFIPGAENVSDALSLES
jgi:hypothetical protein